MYDKNLSISISARPNFSAFCHEGNIVFLANSELAVLISVVYEAV